MCGAQAKREYFEGLKAPTKPALKQVWDRWRASTEPGVKKMVSYFDSRAPPDNDKIHLFPAKSEIRGMNTSNIVESTNGADKPARAFPVDRAVSVHTQAHTHTLTHTHVVIIALSPTESDQWSDPNSKCLEVPRPPGQPGHDKVLPCKVGVYGPNGSAEGPPAKSKIQVGPAAPQHTYLTLNRPRPVIAPTWTPYTHTWGLY